jgi:RNA polymerase sigma-70 factor (ECF subfamily)
MKDRFRLAQHERLDLERAFNEIYRTELPFACSRLRRLGVHERDLPDVGHELFLVVWTKFRTYDRERGVRPWLGGIARKLASDYRRRADHVRTCVSDDFERLSEMDSHRRDAEEGVAASQMTALVKRALEKLDPHRREVLEMHDLNEIPIESVAARQGVPVATAWSRLQSARQKVGSAIKRLAANVNRRSEGFARTVTPPHRTTRAAAAM